MHHGKMGVTLKWPLGVGLGSVNFAHVQWRLPETKPRKTSLHSSYLDEELSRFNRLHNEENKTKKSKTVLEFSHIKQDRRIGLDGDGV